MTSTNLKTAFVFTVTMINRVTQYNIIILQLNRCQIILFRQSISSPSLLEANDHFDLLLCYQLECGKLQWFAECLKPLPLHLVTAFYQVKVPQWKNPLRNSFFAYRLAPVFSRFFVLLFPSRCVAGEPTAGSFTKDESPHCFEKRNTKQLAIIQISQPTRSKHQVNMKTESSCIAG